MAFELVSYLVKITFLVPFRMKEAGVPFTKEAAMAKYYASEVSDLCLQFMYLKYSIISRCDGNV